MPFSSDALREKSGLSILLQRHLALFALGFLLLEIWRPFYFLTDDNLSAGFPVLTEIGRHLKAGKSPFVGDYLFGGHYNLLRDIGTIDWHPFYLASSLLADTGARFWIMDLIAFLFLLVATVGFTLLAYRLRRDFNPTLPNACLTLFTFSYLFSTYGLTVGASWVDFLANLGALPWLALGILDEKALRGAGLVALFTLHEALGGYATLSLSCGICLTFFAVGMAIDRRSPLPVVSWCAGSLVGLLLSSPFLLQALIGFAHSPRVQGFSAQEASDFAIPFPLFSFSFFSGNWTALLARWMGVPLAQALAFPCLSTLLACAAAWWIVPALAGAWRWRFPEALCLGIVLFSVVLIVRPRGLALVMQQVPFLRSMRWPFREALEFLFFLHLLFILRPLPRLVFFTRFVAGFSVAMFLVPLFFIPAPCFNLLVLDRQALLSGRSDAFWKKVKATLGPDAEIATVINLRLFKEDPAAVPYSLLGTANFPAFYQVKCDSGYSPTAPSDQLPLKTFPGFWFGAFTPEQVPELLAARPGLKLIQLEGTHPLRIVLVANGKTTDLSPDLGP